MGEEPGPRREPGTSLLTADDLEADFSERHADLAEAAVFPLVTGGGRALPLPLPVGETGEPGEGCGGGGRAGKRVAL